MIILQTPFQRHQVLHLSRKAYVEIQLIILQAVLLDVHTDYTVKTWLELDTAQDRTFQTVSNFPAPFPLTPKEELVFFNFVCFERMYFLQSNHIYLRICGMFIPGNLDHENTALKNGHFATKPKIVTFIGCEAAVLKYCFWNANGTQTHVMCTFLSWNSVIYSCTK